LVLLMRLGDASGEREEARPVSTGGGARCVRFVPGEGRGVSGSYQGRDEACPVSTGGATRWEWGTLAARTEECCAESLGAGLRARRRCCAGTIGFSVGKIIGRAGNRRAKPAPAREDTRLLCGSQLRTCVIYI
jgi:hypothetical protein